MSPLKLGLDVRDRKSEIWSMRRICWLEDGRSHMARNIGGSLVTTCKEQGTSILQLQGAEVYQQGWTWKWIFPQRFQMRNLVNTLIPPVIPWAENPSMPCRASELQIYELISGCCFKLLNLLCSNRKLIHLFSLALTCSTLVASKVRRKHDLLFSVFTSYAHIKVVH